MINKITIKILKDNFSVSFGGTPRIRKDASTIYNWVERKLGCLGRTLASHVDTKTAVLVDYGQGHHNETETTNNPSEILYALAAFLEDYLPKPLLVSKYRKYGGV